MTAFLELAGIRKTFGSFTALENVDLAIERGEFLCFLGPSGCGKTTLLRIVAGLEAQTAGRITMAGRDISTLPPAQRDYGIVFQSYALFPNLNVDDNAASGLVNRRVGRAEARARVTELLGLEGLPGSEVPTLPEEAPADLTERQLIDRHSRDENCMGCHKRIDPYGFALEGFDAIGRARKADTKTVLPDGTAVDGLDGLRNYLITQRRDDFTRQFCRKLLGYALGRSVQLSDKPLIEQMMKSDLRFGTLVWDIVSSRQFREMRGR